MYGIGRGKSTPDWAHYCANLKAIPLRVDAKPRCCNDVATVGMVYGLEVAMIKTLRRQGNGQALPIDKSMMDAMGIDLDTPLEVTLTANTMVVTPVHVGLSQEDLDASLSKMRSRYGNALKALAT